MDMTEMLQLQWRSSCMHSMGIRTAYLFLLVGSLVFPLFSDLMLPLVFLGMDVAIRSSDELTPLCFH